MNVTLRLVAAQHPDRRARRAIGQELAAQHGGVVHRDLLARHGIDRHAIRTEVDAGRWFPAGAHTLVVGGQVPTGDGRLWQAVWESGPQARLDGAAALIAGGMTGFRPDAIDVTVPAGGHYRRIAGVVLHRPRTPSPGAGAGIPRVAVECAAIHAAQWAVSDRQAASLICLPVQQRLTTPTLLLLAWRGVQRSPRRALLDAVILDVCDGAHSLGELNFGRLCRRVALPPPDRQVVRQGPRGRVYLDASWDRVGLVVEIDGGHHQLALNPMDDALRQNDRIVRGERVLRIPVVGLRFAAEDFMRQVRQAYDAR